MEVDVEAFSDPSFNSESPTSPRRPPWRRRLCCQCYWRNSLSSSFYTLPVPVSRQMQHGGVVQENGGVDQQHQQPEVQVSALPPREPSQVPPEMQDSKHQEQLSIGSGTESTRPFSCDNHHTYYQHQHQPPLQIPPASEAVFRYASVAHPAPALPALSSREPSQAPKMPRIKPSGASAHASEPGSGSDLSAVTTPPRATPAPPIAAAAAAASAHPPPTGEPVLRAAARPSSRCSARSSAPGS
ncbi:hypothetical protein GALMADRAFT_1254010 [Galerina marginata CBS 339.88]|uniref:Uncharacterized protein n=1 Tax=Galerina marginata (strain CBS 339.88) TaxID=685588 RepID=A0A067T5S6_GALM3|nr:hypothetical protein GALMADRAFT_1254010 [Galerina marginata CBS 339.88]